MDYKFIYWGSNTREENYIKNISLKTKIQLINLFMILHKLILGFYVIMNANIGIYVWIPIITIIFITLYNIFPVD